MSAGQRLCALGLHEVAETLRPPAVVAVDGTPHFIRGLAIIRGQSLPVLDLGALFTGNPSTNPERVVTLRVGTRMVALLVDRVLGVRSINDAQLTRASALLGDVATEVVSALGRLDDELLVVLRAGQVVPADTWALLDSAAEGAQP